VTADLKVSVMITPMQEQVIFEKLTATRLRIMTKPGKTSGLLIAQKAFLFRSWMIGVEEGHGKSAKLRGCI